MIAGDGRARGRAARGRRAGRLRGARAARTRSATCCRRLIDCDREPAASARASRAPRERQPSTAARSCCCARAARWRALDPGGSAVGFHVLPPLRRARAWSSSRAARAPRRSAAQRAERFFAALGKHVAWVGDAPGLVLGRIVCQVINESAFALGEGVGSARDIDIGHGARAEPPARPARVGATRSASTTCSPCSRRCATSTARSATGPRRRCAGSCAKGASARSTRRGLLRVRPRLSAHLTSRAASRALNGRERRRCPPSSASSTSTARPCGGFLVVLGRAARGRRLLPGDVHRGAARLPAPARATRTCGRGC